jgi:ABC-type multidrug transport system fused ATPase/permease subunit
LIDENSDYTNYTSPGLAPRRGTEPNMKTTSKGRTTIFISYRVPTVRNAARIVELGTHDELITLNGYYTDLHNKQLLEE